MIHITGGGFYDNIPRALPSHLGAKIDSVSWKVPQIFKMLQQWGNVEPSEMYRAFNMGIGMIVIASPEEGKKILKELSDQGEEAFLIGQLVLRENQSQPICIEGIDS